jgi:hypothetical protein
LANSLDEIHELIGQLEVALKKLDGATTKQIDVGLLPELSDAALEIIGWSNTAYADNTLGTL